MLTLWGLPATIWSLLGALVGWRLGWIKFQQIYTNPKLPYAWALYFSVTPNSWADNYMNKMLKGKLGGAKGATHGHIIAFREKIIPPERRKAIVLHELRHTWQFMTFGIFQPIIYSGWNILMRPKLGPLGAYYTNPFERDAYIFSGEKELYKKRLREYRK